MRRHRMFALAALVSILVLTWSVPATEAGGAFGIHIGTRGFGVSVGFGDWGLYSISWSDPYWTIDFNACLSGYGNWVWVRGLGRVWRPWVAASWQPYTYGRWVSTSYGLTWVAYEPWGYIPHHYGNWAYSSFGWVWVPGYSYSSANVTWVRSGAYVGWYACPPRGWSHAARGFHHGYRHGYRDGYDNGYWNGWIDARYATYVGWRHLGAENLAHHTVSHHRVASKHRIESLGRAPTSHEIRSNGGHTITQTRISHRTVTMNGREISIARPEGLARSIERNAAESAERALSAEALQRRQPQVRVRTNRAPSTARSSKSSISSQGATRRSAVSLSRSSSSDRASGVGTSGRIPQERRSASRSSQMRHDAPLKIPSSEMERHSENSRRVVPRSTARFEISEPKRSRNAPRAVDRAPSAARPQSARSSKRLSGSRQSPKAPTRHTSAASREASPSRERATSSRRSRSQEEKTSTSRPKRAASKKSLDRRARRRAD